MWGLSFGYSESVEKFDDISKETDDLVGIIRWLIWLRAYIVVQFAAILLGLACVVGYVHAAGGGNLKDEHRDQLSRIPIVRGFLQRRVKEFNEAAHGDETCAICLEEFKEDDEQQIAELNCSSKHIFHLECLVGWLAKHDLCPLCRQKV